MKILLDTCTFLWIISEPKKLTPAATSFYQDATNQIYLSAASVLEIVVKNSIHAIELPEPAVHYVPKVRNEYKILPLPIDEKSVLFMEKLSSLHEDPFDRMLIAQAIVNEMAFLTPRLIVQYPNPIKTLW